MAEKKQTTKKRIHKKVHIVKRKNAIPVVMDSVEMFMVEFLKNGGNVGQAAMKVGHYSSIKSANAAGSRFLAKAKQRGLIRTALEKRGYDYGKLVDVALEKMEKSKKPDWWDRIMKMADYDDFVSSQKVPAGTNIETLNIFGAHRKLSEDYVEDAEIEDGEPAQDED